VQLVTSKDIAAPTYRVAADIGGTFTDIALVGRDGTLLTRKVPSTPDDYSRAIVDGVVSLLQAQQISRASVAELLHASTVATNAILEGKGALTALVTTRGFRDVLELRRIRVPRLYEPLYEKPRPLVPRRRRFEVTERMSATGEVLVPLDDGEINALADTLARADVESVAVTFLHSYVNPAHERRVGEILRACLPGVYVSLSVDILPEIREYERTSTTVINAYIGPPVRVYLSSLRSNLDAQAIRPRIMMMQSSGGVMSIDKVLERPVEIVESGPAAGVVGAAVVAARSGFDDVITFDMGGTTAKAALIEGGQLLRTDEYEVGGGISLSSRLVKGGGYALKLPVIDVSEVGAGGGSIVWIDRGGVLKVGPRSAGAVPGPACYGTGGTHPTVTDANVVLGYLNPDALAGGEVPIRADLSREALMRHVATPLDQSLEAAAFGVHCLVSSTMMRAVKAVSTYRGRDPRDFTLFAFGGNGGVHAAQLARDLGMRRIVVPPAAGVFSAVGLLLADMQMRASMSYLMPLAAASPQAVADAFEGLERRLGDDLAGDIETSPTFEWYADLRYRGQAFELTVPAWRGQVTHDSLAGVGELFNLEHEKTYGHRHDNEAIELVNLRVVARAPTAASTNGPQIRHAAVSAAARACSARRAYFGVDHGIVETPVIGRNTLRNEWSAGPLIVEEYESTTIVPPYARARIDDGANILIELNS
jgi:N-methylhydantoinase A